MCNDERSSFVELLKKLVSPRAGPNPEGGILSGLLNLSFLRGGSSGSGGITPSGTKNIRENGTYDVTDYASARVNVPQPSGSVNISSNGTYDVTDYEQAVVATPVPTGTKYITANGTHDVSSYASASVTVPDTAAFATINIRNRSSSAVVFTDSLDRVGGNIVNSGGDVAAGRSLSVKGKRYNRPTQSGSNYDNVGTYLILSAPKANPLSITRTQGTQTVNVVEGTYEQTGIYGEKTYYVVYINVVGESSATITITDAPAS